MSGKSSGVGRQPPSFAPGSTPAGTQGSHGAATPVTPAAAPAAPATHHPFTSPAPKLAGPHDMAPRSQPPVLQRAPAPAQPPAAFAAVAAPMPLAVRVQRSMEQAQARRARTAARPITLVGRLEPGVSPQELGSDLRSSRAGWRGTPDAPVLNELSGKAHLFAGAADLGAARFPVRAPEAALTDEQKQGLQAKLHARARGG